MGKPSQDCGWDITVGQLPSGALVCSHSPSLKLIMRTHLSAREAGSAVCICGWEKRRECSPPPSVRSVRVCDAGSQGLSVWEGPQEAQSGQGLLTASSGNIFWSDHPSSSAPMALGSCCRQGDRTLKSRLGIVRCCPLWES